MKLQPRAWITAGIALALGIGLVVASAPRTSAQSSGSDRGFLGLSLQDLDRDLRDSYDYDGSGALVTDVVSGSPADKIGVREGDILIKLDDRTVSGSDQATEYVRARKPGTLVDVWVWRDGKELKVGRAELGNFDSGRWRGSERSTPRTPRAPRAPRAPRSYHGNPSSRVFHLDDLDGLRIGPLGRGRLGVETRDLGKDLGSYFSRPQGGGVLVLDVVDDSPAEKAGLKPGDVILSVGGRDVSDSDELRDAIRDRDAGAVDLRVLRSGTTRTMSVTLEERRDVGSWSWSFDDDDKEWKHYGGKGKTMVIRPDMHMRMFRDLGDDWNELSPQEKKELEKDMEELRKDLRELRTKFRDYRDDDRDGDDEDDDRDDHPHRD
jgi:serine protease Do